MKRSLILVLILGLSSNIILGQVHWTSLSKEVNLNVHCLYVYDNKLIAGGDFSMAGGSPAGKIAAWDGNNWTGLGDGIKGISFVEKMIEYQGDLYVAGEFDSAGSVKAKNIAKWDGTSWTAVGVGSNRGIYSMAVYNDELYVGGVFDSIGGIAASHIAKWNGTRWSALGLGVQGDNVNDLYVYQNQLYVLGVYDSVEYVPCGYLAKWNDTAWSNVGTGTGYGNGGIIEWENSLIVGSESVLIWNQDSLVFEPFQKTRMWNGTDWEIFSLQTFFPNNEYTVFNGNLFCGGGQGITLENEYSFVAFWDGSLWNRIGKGLNKDVVTFCTFNGNLYCGGYFNKDQDGDHNYIAKLEGNVGVPEVDRGLTVSVYPNPVSEIVYIDFAKEVKGKITISILDITGKILQTTFNQLMNTGTRRTQVDLNGLMNGVYLLSIENGDCSLVKKINVIH